MSMKLKYFQLALLVVIAGLFTACSSTDDKKNEYYEHALQLIEKNEQEAAILELRSAIQLDAKFGKARYQLGLLYLKEGDPRKAFSELIRAAELDPDNLDANYRAAQFYLLARKKDESRKLIDHILSIDPVYVDALGLLAELELMEGKFSEAIAALEKIGGEVEKSNKLLNLKGRIFVAQKKWDAAEGAFQRAVALDGDNFINYRVLLQLYEDRKEMEKARNLLDQMVQKFPDKTDPYLLLAGYYRVVGEKNKVADVLKKVIAIAPDKPQFRLQLAEFYKDIGENRQAEEVLTAARTELQNNPDITSALAVHYYEQGRFDEARSLLDEILAAKPGHGGARLLQARFLQKESKVQDAIGILETLNRDFPRWAEPFFYLGLARYSLGEVELAQSAVADAIQKDRADYKYHTLMAELYQVQGAFEEAKAEAAIALRLNQNNLRAAIILSRAFIGAKQYEPAVAVLSDMNKQVPHKVEILSNLALAYFGVKDREHGEAVLAELLELDPGNTEAVALHLALKYKNNLSGAIAYVQEQIGKLPEDHRLYLILGSLLERQKNDLEALAAFEKAQALKPEDTRSCLAAAKLLTALGKKDEALAKYNAMVARQPDSMPGQMGIAALLEAEGDTVKAMSQYRKILKIKEGYAPAANNLAWLVSQKPDGDLGEALMLAMVAKQASPDDPQVADTLGWIYYRRESFSLAMAQFELALRSLPDDPSITYHLALAQKGGNQPENARVTLENLLSRDATFSGRRDAEALLAELSKNNN